MSCRRYLCFLSQSGIYLLRLMVFMVMTGLVAFSKNAAAESCYPINTAQMNFGNYNPESAQHLDIDATIDIYCAPAFRGQLLSVRVSLIGRASQGYRYILNNLIDDDQGFFILFQDAARTIPLTEQIAIPITEFDVRSKIFTIRLYGRMSARQDIGRGTYMTNLMINIDF